MQRADILAKPSWLVLLPPKVRLCQAAGEQIQRTTHGTGYLETGVFGTAR